jgi:hypothetical protein
LSIKSEIRRVKEDMTRTMMKVVGERMPNMASLIEST